jgi:hypothetical protein
MRPNLVVKNSLLSIFFYFHVPENSVNFFETETIFAFPDSVICVIRFFALTLTIVKMFFCPTLVATGCPVF